jgi:plastocyanin
MPKSLVLALLTLALIPAGSASADVPLLIGTVGPGFTIDLADANGKHVDLLVEGRYELLVHDLADVHNFVLGSKTTGARLASTEVEFVGDQTFTIDLAPGQYAYACSPHFEVMNGHFQVVSTPTPVVERKTLSAKVDARSLSLSAKRVAAGRYRLTVVDRSKLRNFHLVGPGVNKRTGKTFTGRVTWTLRLGAGTYRFGSDPRLSGRLVVS